MMAGGGWMMAWQGSNGAQRTGDLGVKGKMKVLRRVRFMVAIARLQPVVLEGQKPHMVEVIQSRGLTGLTPQTTTGYERV